MTACTRPASGTAPLDGSKYLFAWLWALLLAAGLPVRAQEAATPALPPLPDTIRTSITARHVRVPGSTFYVRKPADYEAEESLNGVAKPNGALLEVMRVPQANFNKVRGIIVQQYLAEKGARMAEQRELMFNNYPAVYGEGESIEPGKDLMVLAFGDSSAIMLVFGLYQENDAQSRAELRQMLLSGWYDPRGTVPPLELAPFFIDLSGTPFRLQQVLDNGKQYVFGVGAQPSADSLATRFTVQVLPPTPFTDIRQRLLRLALERTTAGALLRTDEQQVPNDQAYVYEVNVNSTWRGRRHVTHQRIRTDADATLLFDGLTFSAPLAPAKAPTPVKPTAKGSKPAPAPKAAPNMEAALRKAAATLRMKH